MTRLSLPRPQQPLIGAGGIVDRDWYRFLRDVLSSLGMQDGAPVFADKFVDPSSMALTGAAIGALGTFGAAMFDATTSESATFAWRLPSNYLDGSDLSVYVPWAPTSTHTGYVTWSLTYAVINDGVVVPAGTAVTVNDTAGGTTSVVQRANFAAISGTDFRRDDTLLVKLARSATTDTYTADAALLGLGIKYQLEGLGNEVAHP